MVLGTVLNTKPVLVTPTCTAGSTTNCVWNFNTTKVGTVFTINDAVNLSFNTSIFYKLINMNPAYNFLNSTFSVPALSKAVTVNDTKI